MARRAMALSCSGDISYLFLVSTKRLVCLSCSLCLDVGFGSNCPAGGDGLLVCHDTHDPGIGGGQIDEPFPLSHLVTVQDLLNGGMMDIHKQEEILSHVFAFLPHD